MPYHVRIERQSVKSDVGCIWQAWGWWHVDDPERCCEESRGGNAFWEPARIKILKIKK